MRAKAIVATRTFEVSGARNIKAIIYKPVKSRAHPQEWSARFRVEGLSTPVSGRAYGIDSLQARLCAVQRLRNRLESLDVEFRWLGQDVGNAGIERPITWVYGLDHSKRMAQLVTDQETRRVKATTRARQRAKAGAARARPRRRPI